MTIRQGFKVAAASVLVFALSAGTVVSGAFADDTGAMPDASVSADTRGDATNSTASNVGSDGTAHNNNNDADNSNNNADIVDGPGTRVLDERDTSDDSATLKMLDNKKTIELAPSEELEQDAPASTPTDRQALKAPKAPVEDVIIKDNLETDEAYISALSMDQIIDGVAPWDSNDARGNDSSPSNMIVRSFDKVTYNVKFVVTPDDPMTYFRNVYVGFKVTLPYDRQLAGFDEGSLAWAEYDDAHKPKIETLDNGHQVLTCYRKLVPTSSAPYVAPGTYTVPFGINVKAMMQGMSVKPTFEAWTVPNDVKHRVAKLDPKSVTVSSYPRFDVVLGQGNQGYTNAGGPAMWEFKNSGGSGKFASDDLHSDMGKQKGILSELLISVNMRNYDKNKRMKGLELPKKGEPLRYQISMDNEFTKTDGTTKLKRKGEFQPYFWAAHGQVPSVHQFQNRNRETHDPARYLVREDYSQYPTMTNSNFYGSTYNSGNVEVVEHRQGDKTVYDVIVHGWDVDVDKFPTKNNGSPLRCATFSTGTNTCELNEGVIAVQTLRFFAPMTIDGQNVQDYYNMSLRMVQTSRTTGIDVTSATNIRVNTQERTDNDRSYTAQFVEPGGSFSMNTYYSCPTKGPGYMWANGTDCAGWSGPTDWGRGTDSLIRGNDARIMSILNYRAHGMDGLQGVMPINLVKIDDKVLDLPEQTLSGDTGIGNNNGIWRINDGPTQPAKNPLRLRYAVKKDGKGWVNDEEQKKALIDDLDYYEDWNEAKQHGVIVGLLFASPSTSTRVVNKQWMLPSFQVHVKENAPIGYVAQITQHAQMWTRADLINHGVDIPEDDVDAWNEWAKNIDPLQYRKQVKPTYDDRSWDGNNRDYKKTSYDENKQYVPGTEGNRYGDSLTILGEKARVSVTTDQRKPNGTVEQGGKNVYDIDKEQRVIDWRVSGYANITPDKPNAGTTDWTLTVNVPKGTRYVEGSSYFEGDYSENTPLQGSVANGKKIDPYSVTANSDGTTTLVYKLPGQPISKQWRPIHLATTIGDASDPDTDVKNGDQFTLSATIYSTNDWARPDTNNGKKASYTVQAVRTKASNLATRADPLMNEVNSDADFVDMIANSSQQTANNVLTVGQLPKNGVNGSAFHGTYEFHGFDLDSKGVTLGDNIEFYITDVAHYASVDPKTLDLPTIKAAFKKVNVPANTTRLDATNMGVADLNKVTAFALVIKEMPKGSRLDIRIDGVARNNKPADRYVNRYSDIDNVVVAMSTVVSRAVNGRVWVDADKNGERGDNETLVKGVKVRLINRADKSVIRETVCDDKGYYLFDELPAGQYDIMFAGPDNDNWNYYKATAVKAQGVDESRDSDGVSVTQGTLKDGAKIELAELPALDKMVTSRFVINDMDLGVVRLVQLNTMPTTGSMPWLAVIVVSVLFVNIVMIAVLLKVTKKEKESEKQ